MRIAKKFRRKEGGFFQFRVVGNHIPDTSGVSWRERRNKRIQHIFHVIFWKVATILGEFVGLPLQDEIGLPEFNHVDARYCKRKL